LDSLPKFVASSMTWRFLDILHNSTTQHVLQIIAGVVVQADLLEIAEYRSLSSDTGLATQVFSNVGIDGFVSDAKRGAGSMM
jgi:hypothetical protein